ncbi:MAG: disulfide bond formation protein B [Hyphomicrobiales bacterium]|nr:disulfide bond formation protein B [Hyphomicrobiales bacterium]
MLTRLDPQRAATAIFVVALLSIAGALIIESLGYKPCELCLLQRWAYYIGVPLAGAAALTARGGKTNAASALLAAFALLFFANGLLGLYHTGVELHYWRGPEACTGAYQAARDAGDFLKQMQETKVVRCDEVALRLLGLSMSTWQAIAAFFLSTVAFFGWRKS